MILLDITAAPVTPPPYLNHTHTHTHTHKKKGHSGQVLTHAIPESQVYPPK